MSFRFDMVHRTSLSSTYNNPSFFCYWSKVSLGYSELDFLDILRSYIPYLIYLWDLGFISSTHTLWTSPSSSTKSSDRPLVRSTTISDYYTDIPPSLLNHPTSTQTRIYTTKIPGSPLGSPLSMTCRLLYLNYHPLYEPVLFSYTLSNNSSSTNVGNHFYSKGSL